MIGEQIKRLRSARNMSQVELASALNVSKQSVSNWENNNILPSVEVIKQLAQFFSCSSDYLLELDHSTNAYIDVSDLTCEQAAHLSALAKDFRDLNPK
jgi:transcriptional regulator with XRE-family HTH domain